MFSILFVGCLKQAPLYTMPQSVTTHKEKVDAMATPLTQDGWMTALSIALIHPNGVEYYNYGTLKKGADGQPNQNSIYEIGSVSKVFTGLLLADQVQKGKVPLNEPLSSWALPDWTLPSKDGEAFSALHLTTHTSGLPRLPAEFAPPNMQNPYADFSAADFKSNLEQKVELVTKPGETFLYSNIGAGLLGYSLTQSTGMTYEELVLQTIAAPLEMNDTSVIVPLEKQGQVAQGYGMMGEPVPDWDFPAIVGTGELNSSTEDLVRFLLVQFDPPKSALGRAIAMTQERRFPIAKGSEGSDKSAIGMGWHIGTDATPNLIWHTGGTGGARSFVGFDPQEKLGIVVLSTNPSPFYDALGISLYQMLKGEKFDFKMPALSEVSADTLELYRGSYTLGPGVVLNVEPNANHLKVTIVGQPSFPIYPATQTRFNSIHAPLGFEFQKNEAGDVFQLIMFQGKNEIPAPKDMPEKESTEEPTEKAEDAPK
ncbi:MAG: serine hydrolase domain-containing protein [Myxococcota bacterium]|nr:serine hydrolase domain-containing protein [Myxococcota bacterium]